ncbi:hypothetical protein [Flavobacterium tegetincola]|uniref:hypothetical protein n=1 Tax=Flavobacterium tegetincola TaxID=150172 RepID=UPI00040B204D|nr:hypothetical protein [Flavobacterium tegetincola]
MGAIKDAIKMASTTDEEVKKELNLQLDNMTALAKAKADYFNLLLREKLSNAGSGTSKDIPVKFIIDYTSQTHAYASNSSTSIATTITGAISDFVSGGKENVMNGVGALMTKAVETLFGSSDGSEDEIHFTSVFAEGRALVRLDLMAWKRFTKVQKLSTSAEQISAFVMCKSTIDAQVLDYNTFIQLYQKNLYEKASGINAEQIAKELDEIDEIYKKFLAFQKNDSSLKRGGESSLQLPTAEELAKALGEVKKSEASLGW